MTNVCLSVFLSVCLSHHGSVLLSNCVHSICRVRFRFRDRISNEFRRNFKNCKLKEKVRKRGKGNGERGTEEIGKLYNNLARENFCCSMSLLPIVCRTKLSGQVQVQLAEYQKVSQRYIELCRLSSASATAVACQHLFLANAVIN